MIDQQIEIPTKDGHTTTFISHPERGGPHPIILFYMDAPAIREELRDMARRLATSGYYVMLPNLYYRSGVMELGPLPADPESPERKRMFELMASINIPLVMEDTKALLASLPTLESGHRSALHQIGGTPPDPARLGVGCPFRARCPYAFDKCALEEPPLLERGDGSYAACWKAPEQW